MAYGRKAYGRTPFGSDSAVTGQYRTLIYNTFSQNAFPFLDTQSGAGTVTTDITTQAGRLRVRTTTVGGYQGVYWLQGLSGTPLRPGARVRIEVRHSTNADFYVQETVGYSNLFGTYNNTGVDATYSTTITVPANGQLNIVFTPIVENTDVFLDYINIVEETTGYATQSYTGFVNTSTPNRAQQSFNSFTSTASGRANAIYHDDFSTNRLSEYSASGSNTTISLDNGQLKIALSAAQTTGAYHDLTVASGTTYQITGMWRMDGQASTWVGFKVWDTTGAWTKISEHDNTETSSTTELTPFRFTFTTTTSANHLLELYASSSQTSSTTWFDDVAVELASIGYFGTVGGQQITGFQNVAQGTQTITGTGTPSFNGFTNSASGEATSNTVSGTAAQSFNGFTNTSSGAHGVAAPTVTQSHNSFTSTSSGAHGVAAPTVTQSHNSWTSTATGSSVTGTAVQSHNSWTNTASGEQRIDGTAAQTHSGFTSTAAGTQGVPGSAAQTFNTWTHTATGGTGTNGVAAQSVTGFTNTASGSSVSGTAAQTHSGFTNTASGAQTATGSAVQSVSTFTNTATGSSVTGTAAQSHAGFTSTASGTQTITGSAAQTRAAPTQTASGTQGTTGSAVQSHAGFTQASSGLLGETGSAAQSHSSFSGSGTGAVGASGTAAQTQNTWTSSRAGTQGVPGSASQTHNSFTQTASGTQRINGTAAQTVSVTSKTTGGFNVISHQNFDVTYSPYVASDAISTLSLDNGQLKVSLSSNGSGGAYLSITGVTTGQTLRISGKWRSDGQASTWAFIKVWDTTGSWTKLTEQLTTATTLTAFTYTVTATTNAELLLELGSVSDQLTSVAWFDDVVVEYNNVTGGAAQTITGFTNAASGSTVRGSAAQSHSTGTWISTASGTQGVPGSASQTATAVVSTATGTQGVPGTAVQTFNQLFNIASAGVGAAGTAVQTYGTEGWTNTGSAAHGVAGTAAQTFNNFENFGVANPEVSGSANHTVSVSTSATGFVTAFGAPTQTVPAATQTVVANHAHTAGSAVQTTTPVVSTASGVSNVVLDQPFTSGYTPFTPAGGSNITVSGGLLHIIPEGTYQGAEWNTTLTANRLLRVEALGRSTATNYQVGITVWDAQAFTKLYEAWNGSSDWTTFSTTITVPAHGLVQINLWGDVATVESAQYDWIKAYYVSLTTGSAVQTHNSWISSGFGNWNNIGTSNRTFNSFTQTASGQQAPSAADVAQTVPTATQNAAGATGASGSASQSVNLTGWTSTAQGYYDILSFQDFNSGSILPWEVNNPEATASIVSNRLRVTLSQPGSDGVVTKFGAELGNSLVPGRKVLFQGKRRHITTNTRAIVKVWETVTPGWTKLVEDDASTSTMTSFSFSVTVPSNGELLFNIGAECTTAPGTVEFDDLLIVYDPGVTGSAVQTFRPVQTAQGYRWVQSTATQSFNPVSNGAGAIGATGSASQLFSGYVSSGLAYTIAGTHQVLLDFNWLTHTADGAVGATGSAEQRVTGWFNSGFGRQLVEGSATQVTPMFINAADSTLIGNGAQVIPFPTQSATGQQTVGGTAAHILAIGATQMVVAEHRTDGSAGQTVPTATQTASGARGSISTAVNEVPAANQNASGIVWNNGVATQTITPVLAPATGTQGTTGTATQHYNLRIYMIHSAEGGAARLATAGQTVTGVQNSAQGTIGTAGVGANDPPLLVNQAVGYHGVQPTVSVVPPLVSDGRGGFRLQNPVLRGRGKRWGFRY